MTRDDLDHASELLDAAAEWADDEDATRLRNLSEQLAGHAEADRGPDHGTLARIENALNDLEESVGVDAAEDVRTAHEHVKEYRSGVEGV